MQQNNEEYILSNFWKAERLISIQAASCVLRVYQFTDVPLRVLFIDKQFASCIEMGTGAPGLRYLKEMVKTLSNLPSKSKVLILGHGGGALARAALKHGCTVTSVDVIGELFEVTHEYFMVPRSKRFATVVKDAYEYIKKTSKTFDLIFVDVFVNAEDVPAQFKTPEWFRLLERHLTANGTICMNYIGNDNDADDFMRLQDACCEVFPNATCYFVEGEGHLHQNIIITLKRHIR